MKNPPRNPQHLAFVVSAVLWATACSTETSDPGTDSNTNWLSECEEDEECGAAYSCICGLCTQSCDEDAQCGAAADEAVCWRALDAQSSCGAGAPGQLCLPPCHDGVCRDQMNSTPVEDTTEPVEVDPPSVPPAPAQNGGTPGLDPEPVVEPQPGVGGADEPGAGGAQTVGPQPGGTGGDSPSPGGTGGTGGTGGSSAMQSCDEGCEELCQDDACGCVCEPDLDFASCSDSSECIVISDCCACQEVVAVHRDQAEARGDAVCQSGVQCERCLVPGDTGYVPGNGDSQWSPTLVATCIEGRCAVVDLAQSPLTECEQASDCVVREPTCCSSCAPIAYPEYELISIRDSDVDAFNSLVCDPPAPCPDCEQPPYGVASCEAGRCTVPPAMSGQGGAGSGTGGAPSDAPRADGEPCSEASDCESGICEGLGCEPEQGTCVGTQRPCTADLASFCGCDGVTFEGSSTCPGGRYQSVDACPFP